MSLSAKTKKLAKQKVVELNNNKDYQNNSIQALLNLNIVNNEFQKNKTEENLANFLANAYIVRQFIAKKDERALGIQEEFRKMVFDNGISAKELEDFCGTTKLLDNNSKSKIIDIVTSKTDLSTEGVKINNRIDKLIKEYNSIKKTGNNILLEEKGCEILANAYMSKKSYDLRESPAVKVLNERFKNEILPNVLGVKKSDIAKLFGEIEQGIKNLNQEVVEEDNYYRPDPEEVVPVIRNKKVKNDVEQSLPLPDEVENANNNAKISLVDDSKDDITPDVIKLANGKQELFTDIPPTILAKSIKKSVENYSDIKPKEELEENSFSYELDDDDNLYPNSDDIQEKFDQISKEIYNQQLDYKKSQLAYALLAYNMLQKSDELGVAKLAREAKKQIMEGFDINSQDMLKVDDAIEEVYSKGEYYQTLLDGTKEITKDFVKHKGQYKNISNYGEALIKKRDNDKKSYLSKDDSKEDTFYKRERVNGTERKEFLGLYTAVRKTNESRNGFSKFFHPFQNSKEKKIVKELEGRLAKLGINKESLDLIYNKANKEYNIEAQGLTKKEQSLKEVAKINEEREKIPGLANDTKINNTKKTGKEFNANSKQLEKNPLNKE